MTVIREPSLGGYALPVSESPQSSRERRSALLRISRTLRLWRERHRQRQELALLTDRELLDAGVPRDLVRGCLGDDVWARYAFPVPGDRRFLVSPIIRQRARMSASYRPD